MEGNTVIVNIFGEDYPIRGDAGTEYIQQIARYVDIKMKDLANKSPQKNHTKLAVLTALNIADELFAERLEKDKKISDYEKKASWLVEQLDKKLQEVA